jgi:hypothetical protein
VKKAISKAARAALEHMDEDAPGRPDAARQDHAA